MRASRVVRPRIDRARRAETERDALKAENERMRRREVIPCPDDLEEHRKADYHQTDENCPAGVRRLMQAIDDSGGKP